MCITVSQLLINNQNYDDFPATDDYFHEFNF